MNFLKSTILWSIIIFIVAASFRITFLDLIEFKLDEANSFYGAIKFYHEPYIAQNSLVSSTGIYNLPLFFYLITLLAAFFKDPQVISFLIGLINTCLVVVFYLVVRKYYGNLVGLLASLLMASSPWMIIYSRKIWGPDFILLFAIPAFYFIHRLIVDKKPKAIFGLILSLVLLFQLHFSGLTLLLVTLVVLFILKAKISWKFLILGLIIGLIPTLPYVTSGSFSCNDCIIQTERVFDSNNLFRGFQIINGSYFENILGDDYALFLEAYNVVKLFNFLFIFQTFLLILGIIYLFKDKNRRFLLLYLLIVPLLAFITQTPARMYYFLSIAPITILIYGLSAAWFWQYKGMVKYLGVSLIVLTIFINLLFELFFYQFLAEKQALEGDYGVIFKLTKQAVEQKFKIVDDLSEAEAYLKMMEVGD